MSLLSSLGKKGKILKTCVFVRLRRVMGDIFSDAGVFGRAYVRVHHYCNAWVVDIMKGGGVGTRSCECRYTQSLFFSKKKNDSVVCSVYMECVGERRPDVVRDRGRRRRCNVECARP